jgi:serine/threonine protein kinase
LQGEGDPPGLSKFLDIAEDIATGMAAIHAKNTLFRGLQPSKLLFDVNGRVKITGFGHAANVRRDEPLASVRIFNGDLQ